ncbi:probable E3 ubiquitin-protein ligase BAH1-like isoform X2 [Pistacia vera]|uniref:probable E3 ubiquitin-protein ligase BAH1-like isoform X2 n=1 Tax=Pistacia vera TaxID=55513 RepID=UPI0012639729|nr:probable E3 ubiquitin-protein ligase BAH1-like isoform X2 [Pistacia vera]
MHPYELLYVTQSELSQLTTPITKLPRIARVASLSNLIQLLFFSSGFLLLPRQVSFPGCNLQKFSNFNPRCSKPFGLFNKIEFSFCVLDECDEKRTTMKFGETFTEYLHGDREGFLEKCSHVEYKRLKKVLKVCRSCKGFNDSSKIEQNGNHHGSDSESELYQCQSCSSCDQMFFSELMKEASDIAGCFSSRARHLLHLHVARGMQRYVLRVRQCFKNDQQAMLEEGRMLIEYVTMNATAIRKILKKYDKVHGSVNGKNFKSKMRAEHIELLQSPWLIELGAFYLNFNGIDNGESIESSGHFSCDFNPSQPVMKLSLPNSIKLEYDLTCAICLAGGYANAVHMLELDLLLKRRFKDYWKERMNAERAEMVKQAKEFWESQTKFMIGYY